MKLSANATVQNKRYSANKTAEDDAVDRFAPMQDEFEFKILEFDGLTKSSLQR